MACLRNNRAVFLGYVIPDELAKEIFSIDSLPAIQTQKFGWSLVRSLNSIFMRLDLVSVCPIQNFPLGKRVILSYGRFSKEGINGVYLGFVNILLIKHITRFISLLSYTFISFTKKKPSHLIIHGLHLPYIIFGLIMKFFNIKITCVLTDRNGIVLPTDSWLSRLLKKLDFYLVKSIVKRFDSFIVLSPYLLDVYGIKRNSLVIPGVLSSTFIKKVEKSKPKIVNGGRVNIVYAGGLNAMYGVAYLIDAVKMLPAKNFVLTLYGWGDLKENFLELSKNDNRFHYGGLLNENDLIDKLIDADLLINPRPSNEAFSQSSFPSKLIEYLAIGRPILTTRLAGIPHSLSTFFNYIDDESPSGICSAILSVTDSNKSVLESKSSLGQAYVKNSYSEEAIGKSIQCLFNK